MKSLLVFVLVAAAFVYVSADCSGYERLKVKIQWRKAFGEGRGRLKFGIKLWSSIFREHPEMRFLFARVVGNNVFSPEFQAHSQRVLSGLDMTISSLDDQPVFDAQVAHLKQQHAERKLKGDYFVVFRNHLLDVLVEYFGPKLDYDAWRHCIDYINDLIKP